MYRKYREGWWQWIVETGLDSLLMKLHVMKCEDCKKKYVEILKHAEEMLTKDAKKVSVSS